MNRKISRLICTVLTAALLLSGCAERDDVLKGKFGETEASTTTEIKKLTTSAVTTTSEGTTPQTTTTTVTTTAPETTTVETTAKTTIPETTTPVTTMLTTTPSPEDIYGGPVYTDANGEALLALTDGIEYIDYIAYYHGYYKVTNISDKTVTDLREKLVTFDVFADTESMTIEYPFGDNCMDIIEWNNGKPDFENMQQYFDAMAESDYTFDNTLAPDEYCIISVRFNNGTEITTTTVEKPETTTTTEEPEETTTTTAPETTTAPQTEEKPLNTTEKPLSDVSYSEFMPKDDIIKEAAEIAVRDGQAVIAIYKNGTYKAMSYEEATDLMMVQVYAELISRETYESQVKMMEEYPELYGGEEYDEYYSSYEAFVSAMLESLKEIDEECAKYFDDKGNVLVNTDPFFAIDFTFEGDNEKTKAKKAAETAIRWVFSLRADANGLESLIDESLEWDGMLYSVSGGSLTAKCTYDGGDSAEAEASYYYNTYTHNKSVLLTF